MTEFVSWGTGSTEKYHPDYSQLYRTTKTDFDFEASDTRKSDHGNALIAYRKPSYETPKREDSKN